MMALQQSYKLRSREISIACSIEGKLRGRGGRGELGGELPLRLIFRLARLHSSLRAERDISA